jgi:O-acetylserine/cysteine efflux transporter
VSDFIQHDRIPLPAIAQALLIAAIWGFNFVVIKVGVASIPPLMLATLRFTFSVFPAIFLVRKPAASWKSLAGYGLFLGVVEFGLLFTAIKLGAPAGLSSLILQSQAFFTALIAAVVLKEKIRAHNLAGMLVAGGGLALIAMSQADGSARLSLPLLFMILASAIGWAAANVIARTMPGSNGFALVVWSSLFSPVPLAVLSLVFEGPRQIAGAVRDLGWLSFGALAYLVVMSTLIGYGLWNRLIMRHGASRIAPFSLLVPIFGVASAALFLGEQITAHDAVAAGLIMAGLAVHVFGWRMGKPR